MTGLGLSGEWGNFKICRELDSIITDCSFEQVKTTLFVLFVALLSAGCGHKSKMLSQIVQRWGSEELKRAVLRVVG